MLKDIKTTVITGALGTGKTTAIRHAFAHLRPPGERWAVLVNEFGEIGLDGALFENSEGLGVKEVAGGCICCAAGLELKVALAQLIRKTKPDRVIVEPSGLAKPTSVLDALATKGLALGTPATIALVGLDRPLPSDEASLEQVAVADVLVGNHADLATDDQKQQFLDWAAKLHPSKSIIAISTEARLQAAWLDPPPPKKLVATDIPGPVLVGIRALSRPTRHTDAASKGWTWPPDVVFNAERLLEQVQQFMGPMQDRVLRVKAVMRTQRGWRIYQGIAGQVRVEGALWRSDSRLEVIASDADAMDWNQVDALIQACRDEP